MLFLTKYQNRLLFKPGHTNHQNKKCFVYKKLKYQLTNHPELERKRIKNQYFQVYKTLEQKISYENVNIYILKYKKKDIY